MACSLTDEVIPYFILVTTVNCDCDICASGNKKRQLVFILNNNQKSFTVHLKMSVKSSESAIEIEVFFGSLNRDHLNDLIQNYILHVNEVILRNIKERVKMFSCFEFLIYNLTFSVMEAYGRSFYAAKYFVIQIL